MALMSAALVSVMWTGVDGQRADAGESRNFDARIAATEKFDAVLPAAQAQAIQGLRSFYPDVSAVVDEKMGVTRTLMNQLGYLTLDNAGREPLDLALDYVRANAVLLGLEAEDLVEYEVTDLVPNRATGSTHVYLRQMLQGVPVYNGQLHVNINRDGRVMSVNNQFVAGLAKSINLMAPGVSAPEAVAAASAHLRSPLRGQPRVLSAASGITRETLLDHAGISQEPIKATLMFLPIQQGVARLVWNFQIYTLDSQHAYDFTVDADSGGVWTRFDWVASDQYRVYQVPIESPNHSSPASPADGRTLQNNPADTTGGSPYGWHDTNGAPGAEYNITRGNTVHAYEDANNDGLPPVTEVDCGTSRICDFALDLTMVPSTYIPAAVTNLFYWNNIIHDIQYRYGFTEAAGNFQVNNYGNGGLGNDDVRAEAQDGGGTNNANFLTPADGSRPRMQMYNWTLTTPGRDGDLDAGIIVHEYGHGISNRLVGGPSNVSCLGNSQQPGEGLSDWWTLFYTARVGQTGPLGRGVGTYALGQPTTGTGIRALPYSTDNAVNNWTYASINGMAVPHGVGSVWAQAAWEMYWALVNQHGFDANLYNATGTAGNQRANLYVTEGLMNSVCSPAFTDVRDGIIQAAVDNHGGADVCRVWTAFAGIGLGADAVSGGPNSTTPTNGFGVPSACLPPGSPSLSVNNVSVTEGTATANFTVSLSASSTLPVTVNYTTQDNTAISTLFDVSLPNPGAITIPAGAPTTTNGPAGPYPSNINVALSPGPIVGVKARLNGFSHTFPADVDVLLVGPTGQTVVLMSDVGGGTDVTGIDLTFSDSGAPMPGVLTTGTYVPTNIGTGDIFPMPAPAGPHGTTLSGFNGLNPVGTWSLYVLDDAAADVGSLSGGWTLILSTPTGDYVARSGQLMFPPGTTSLPLTVSIVDDTAVETAESFFVNLYGAVNAFIGDAQGVGTIMDNDGGATNHPMFDIGIDFGAGVGLWGYYNAGPGVAPSWMQLHSLSPTVLTRGDLDGNGLADLVVNFQGYGIFAWMNNTSYVHIHPLDATNVATGDLNGNGRSDLVINFPGIGVWVRYDNGTWIQLHSINPTVITTGNIDGDGGNRADVLLHLPGFGIWAFMNNATFQHIHPATVLAAQIGDLNGNGVPDIVVHFQGIGVWARYDNGTWMQLHPFNPTSMTLGNIDGDGAGRMDLVVNFPGYGIWAWMNNSSWVHRHPFEPTVMTTGDVDGNQAADLVVNFPGYGVWVLRNNTSWAPIHPFAAELLTTGRIDNN
jgi:extracellular elastinolytic metalloproteinase